MLLAGAAILLRRTGFTAPESRILVAWLLYPVIVLVPVFLSPEPFRYFRRFYFAYPLFPLLAASLATLRRGWILPVTVMLLAWSAYEIAVIGRAFLLSPS